MYCATWACARDNDWKPTGLRLVDYLLLEELARQCEEQRWSLFCLIAPLRLVAGTGSPVNPIAVL